LDSEKKYRLLVENSNDLIFKLDGNGNLLFLNESARKTLGYPVKILETMCFYDLIHSDDRSQVQKAFSDTYSGTSLQNVTIKMKDSHDSIFVMSCNAVPVADEIGRVKEIMIYGRDITKIREVEERLHFEREQLLSIFDSINHAILVVDPNTYEILYANPFESGSYASGKPDEHLIGKVCYKALHGRVTPCDFCTNSIIFKHKEKPYKWEFHNLITDSDYELTDRAIRWPDGRLVRFELAIDITERKKAEAELFRAEEYLKNVVDSASEVIFTLGVDGRIKTWNATLEYLTGYKAGHILDKSFRKLEVFKQSKELIETIIIQCKGDSSLIKENAHISLQTREGGDRVLQVSISKIKDVNQRYIGLLFIGKDITSIKELHGRLLWGASYLNIDESNKPMVSLFSSLTESGNKGLFITRASPEIVKGMFLLADNTKIMILAEDTFEIFESIISLDNLTTIIRDFCVKQNHAVIAIDRIDYLINRYTFENFMKCLYKINNIVAIHKALFFLYVNSSVVDARQLAAIQAEMEFLPGQQTDIVELADELYVILQYLYEQEKRKTLVSYKKIRIAFRITSTTTAKRIQTLENKGLIYITKQGKSKIVHLTDKARSLVHRRLPL
jgi:PAS domain S-box-containing protein